MLLQVMNDGRRNRATGLLCCCLLFVVLPRCEAQVNLIPNSSFEELEECPNTIGFQLGDRPLHWYSWLNSPDYFHACAMDTLVGVPGNGWTYQYAWDGDAYVGVYAYDGSLQDYREYLGTELLEPLVPGCTYRLRFRANPAYNGSYWLTNGGGACNNLGMLFTVASNAWTEPTSWPPGPDFPVRNYAHLHSSTVISDTGAWSLVEGDFVADSAYAFVVLGNFFSDALTDGGPNLDSEIDVTYYLIDEVEVISLDPDCHAVGMQASDRGQDPTVRWMDDMLEVHWHGSAYEAVMVDVAGRRIIPWQASEHHVVRFAKPSASGLYVIWARSAFRQVSIKFVVL